MEPNTENPQKNFLNRATPFSKVLALVLFVVLPVLTLFAGYKYGHGDEALSSPHPTPKEVQTGFQGTKLTAQLPSVAFGIERAFTSPEETYPMKIIGHGKVLDSAGVPATVPSINENGFFGDAGAIVFEMEEMDALVLQEKIAKNSLPENTLSFEDVKGGRVYVACAAPQLNLTNPEVEAGTVLAVPELGRLCNPWTIAVKGSNGQASFLAGNAAN